MILGTLLPRLNKINDNLAGNGSSPSGIVFAPVE